MSSSILLLDLNIERRRHVQRLIPLVKSRQPEVICLQEVMESDFAYLKEQFAMEGIFVQRATYLPHPDLEGTNLRDGIALFTNLPLKTSQVDGYDAFSDPHPELSQILADRPQVSLLTVTVEKASELFTIATTHFTWSANGKANKEQEVNLEKLEGILAQFPSLVLCGDFNAPRGGAIFTRLAKRYQDNIPLEVTTTLDGRWHRAGLLPYVVDGLFTTKDYRAESVEIISNVSDHCAIIARVCKITET